MSLNRRIIFSASLVLAVFISLTAIALERAFVDSSESYQRDTLITQLYALMAAAELEESKIIMPSDEIDVLLGLPSSGIYARITDSAGNILWQSSSVLGVELPPVVTLDKAVKRFARDTVDDNAYYSLAYGVEWEADGRSTALTFSITTDLKAVDNQIAEYRRTLWGWLLAMAVLLLISQAAILRWGLSPLRRVGEELNLIESGDKEQIQGDYPVEIERLTGNINLLLEQERKQKTRYRDALGDLAHSLKTPLAVLQSGLDSEAGKDDNLQQQITRMNNIVEYQLQRAATAGAASLGKAVDVRTVCQRLLESLNKVYRDKSIESQLSIDHGVIFQGDEGDLLEVLGNLLDNAFKWAVRKVDIDVVQDATGLHITVSDDGPGIADDRVEELMQRGKRADQTTSSQVEYGGHGIGLSIVHNIVQAYEGSISITRSRHGGASVSVIL